MIFLNHIFILYQILFLNIQSYYKKKSEIRKDIVIELSYKGF